jgi:hypothetical protein
MNITNNQQVVDVPAPEFHARQEDTSFGNKYGRGNIWPEFTAIPAGTLTASQKTLMLASFDSFFYALFPYELEEVTDNGATYVRIKTQFYDPGWQIDTRVGAPALDPIAAQLAAGSEASRNQQYGGYSAWYGDNDIGGGSIHQIERMANFYWKMRQMIVSN